VGNNVVRANPDQPLPFPLVGNNAFGLVRRYSNCYATDTPHLLDFHVSIAEPEQLMALNARHAQNSLYQDALGEALVILEGSISAAVKIFGDVKECGLLLQKNLIGATGQVHSQTALLQLVEQRP